MKIRSILTFILVSLALSGCFRNEKEFNSGRALAKSQPELVAKARAACTDRLAHLSGDQKKQISWYSRTDKARMPETLCSRWTRSYVSGRMTWNDYISVIRHQKFTPNMLAIMRGG